MLERFLFVLHLCRRRASLSRTPCPSGSAMTAATPGSRCSAARLLLSCVLYPGMDPADAKLLTFQFGPVNKLRLSLMNL